MFAPDQYQLLDFGDGRRLESFASVVLDRPCPAADGVRNSTSRLWAEAAARFERLDEERGQWIERRPLPERWTVAWQSSRFELKRTDFGHLGLFPEQAESWQWIAAEVARANRPLRVLNLFAYTGGSTLAAAAAGAEVTHVDSARNVVAWARRNAELSGLASAPVRWIGEDARKFVRRELQRGNAYDAVILDPPSYGHGPRGEVWRLAKHLDGLLAGCARLTAGRRRFVLLTCHTPGYDGDRLRMMMEETMGGADRGRTTTAGLVLRSATGRQLLSGIAVRWESLG